MLKNKRGLLPNNKIILDDIIYAVLFMYLYFHVINSMSLLTYKYDLTLLRVCIYFCKVILFMYCIYSNRKMNMKQLFKLFVFMFVAFVTWWRVDPVFLDIFMLALTKKRNTKKTINTFFYSLMFSTVTIICINAIGIMPQYISYRSDGVRRYTLGFSHANYLGFMIVLLVAILLMKDDGKHRIRDTFLVIVATLFCYYIPNSLTATTMLLIMGAIIIIQQLYQHIFKKMIIQNKLVQKILIIALPCTAVFLYYLVFNLNKSFTFDTNYTLWSRIAQSRNAMNRYGISIWGQNVGLVSSMEIYFGRARQGTFFALDSLFVYLPICYGIVPSIYFAYQYIKCMNLYIKKNNFVAIMICVILIFYSMMETVLLNVIASFIFICAYADDR